MKTKLKQLVYFLMLVLFAANISGALFLWHITIEGGCEHHDSDNCPICQNTFINSAKIIKTPSTATISVNTVVYVIEYKSNAPLTSQHRHHIIPRAPPA